MTRQGPRPWQASWPCTMTIVKKVNNSIENIKDKEKERVITVKQLKSDNMFLLIKREEDAIYL